MDTANILEGPESRMLVALRVRQSDADSCAAKLLEMDQRLALADGFVGMDVIRRDGGLGVDFFVLTRFRDLAALEAWKISPERTSMLGDIEALAIADVSRQQAAGANIWFEPIGVLPSTPKPPLFWKRWATSMLAVYPALVILAYVLKPVTRQLPEAIGLFLVAAILTGLSTAYIVPYLTRTLGPWLGRR